MRHNGLSTSIGTLIKDNSTLGMFIIRLNFTFISSKKNQEIFQLKEFLKKLSLRKLSEWYLE